MTLLQRLRNAASERNNPLYDEAADALLQQAEEKLLMTGQIEQLRYRVDTLRAYVDELERRVPHGHKATNSFD